MFYSRMISKVRKELENIGCFFSGEINFIKVKEDMMLFEAIDKGVSYLIKYYEFGDVNNLVNKYELLENIGIKTEEIVTYGDNVIVCENMEENYGYQLLKKSDLCNEDQVRKFARWCECFNVNERSSYPEFITLFMLDNIKTIVKKFNLYHNKFINYVIDNFNNIKMKYEKVNKSIILGGFVDNILFCEEKCDFIVCSVNNIFLGSRYEFVCNLLEIIDEKYKSIFYEEFGQIKKEDQIIGEVVGCISNLYIYSKCNANSNKVKKYLDMICDNKMIEMARTIVEWY